MTTKFNTTVVLGGKTATGLPVPDEIVERLGSGKRPAVRVTIGGHTYRSTVAAMGGVFMLPLSAENRAGAGVKAGDEVEVELELDTAPREIEVPADLAAALKGDEEARRFFDSLSFSHKRRYVDWIQQAKKEETRAARVLKAAAMLREGRTQG